MKKNKIVFFAALLILVAFFITVYVYAATPVIIPTVDQATLSDLPFIP